MGLYVGNKFVIKNSDFIVNEGSSTGIGTTENEKLIASNGDASDLFGRSVAAGSDRIVVGAHYDDISANNNQGSAYVYDLDGNEVGIITASDGVASDTFGSSVAVGSGKIVVGATGAGNGGAAYIYNLDGTNEDRITASDVSAGDGFGMSVAVGCGKVVVGAGYDDWGSETFQGSAYVYDLDGNQLDILRASDGADRDYFGIDVAVGNGRIVVGAYGRDNGSNASQGAAYIFDLNGNQLGIITASDGPDFDSFGYSVAVGYGKIVVGTNNGGAVGAVYIYDLDGTNEVKITASDGAASDGFGSPVAVGSRKIVVGSKNQNSNLGAAYIYDLDGTNEVKITASDAVSGDYNLFGNSVSAGSGRIVVGASYNDIGSNGSQGAAYMWKIDKTLSDYYDDIVDNYRY